MKAIAWNIRPLIHPRVAQHVDDGDILGHERIDDGRRHADGRALRRLPLRQAGAGEEWEAGQVGHVCGDDSRRGRARPDAVQQGGVVVAECSDLGVDVRGRIAAARTAAERRGDGVDLVAAGDDGD